MHVVEGEIIEQNGQPEVADINNGSLWMGINYVIANKYSIMMNKFLIILRMREEECFNVLGISFGSSSAEIRAAYKAKALKYHPDKAPEGKQI